MQAAKAADHLRQVDIVMAKLVEQFGLLSFQGTRRQPNLLASLVTSIIYQSISVKSANAVYQRFLGLYPETPFPTAERILETAEADLRQVGLSFAKITYLKAVAAKTAAGQLVEASLREASDDAIVQALTQIKGVGQWTAQMCLIFYFQRPDILPSGDLGIRAAIRDLYRLPALPTPPAVAAIGAGWSPYKTTAALYLWCSRGSEHANLLADWL
ncbi:DNA-3-methyladenine glycosylase family protein [Almyronema epifaneia]|uniref:DNA-3-methyladenine glycosylase II n=1 Tax=Almyronema epifaneia S1 TaxID=2991925 RepID=A0ABW6IAS9_9CYAN